MPLRGRAEELDILAGHLRAAVLGQGALVVVEGPAGIGKTRLLAEVGRLAHASGFSVAACSAEQQAQAPLAAVLAPLGAGDPPLVQPRDIDGLEARPDRRFWLFERLHAIVAERARRSPVLVSLDAAQWAEPLVLRVLRALAQPRSEPGSLWIVARRPHPASAELERALARFASEGATRLQLAPLARDAVASLAEDTLGARPEPAVMELVEGAGGNPFYVTELLQSLAQEGAVEVEAGRARLVRRYLPARFLSAVNSHLNAMSVEARRLLAGAAIFGRAFSLQDVASLLECPGGRLVPAAREALQALVLVEDRSRLAFAQPLLREVVYEGLPVARRRQLHREAAAVLHQAGAPVGEAALQLAIGARPGDQRAIGVLQRAAGQLGERSPGVAADILMRVLELLPRDDPDRAAVGERATAMLCSAGRIRTAEQVTGALLHDGASAKDDPVLGLRLAQTLILAGRFAEAGMAAAAALERPDLPATVRARLLAAGAAAAAHVERPAAAQRAARAAIAGAAGVEAVVVGGLCSAALAELRQGRLRQAARAAAEAVRRADAAPAEARRRHPRLTLGLTALALDRLDDAEQALLAVRQEAEEYGSSWSLPHLHALQAELLTAWGRLDAAAAEAETALAMASETGARQVAARALGVLTLARLRMGALGPLGPARRRAHELIAGADAADSRLVWALAVLADADGDPAGVLRLYAAPGLARSPLDLLAVDPLIGPHAVRILMRAGDAERAAAAAGEISRLARRNEPAPTVAGCALHASSLLGPDVDGLRRAAGALAGSPRPLALASVLEDLGKALRPPGHREEAVAALEEAFAIYGAAGAARDAARVRRALRALGMRRRYGGAGRGPSRAWDALTRTELAVVALVAEGLTNRGIADRLFVSSSTVGTHLRHVFAKLGITSRVQLTRLALTLSAESAE